MKGKKTLGLIAETVGRIADNWIVAGAVSNAIEDTLDNPKGRFDWLKLIRVVFSATLPTVLLLCLLKGVITVEQLNELLDKILQFI